MAESKSSSSKVFTVAELEGLPLVAFQGGVYDLSDFAITHPGGSELITDW